ncbi:MAG: CBS domain-containing protein [Candidatus Pacearchaeota archaeon]
MQIGIKVGDIMTRNVISVKPTATITECAKCMVKKDIGLLIVKDNRKLKGIITEKDIIWALTKKQDLHNVKVKDIMLRKITTIKPSRDIYEALVRMRNKKLRWLPVTVKGNVIGILTIKDILRIEPSLFEIAVGNMQIKEETEKLKRISEGKEGRSWTKEGECEECGTYGLLYDIDRRLICEECEDRFF